MSKKLFNIATDDYLRVLLTETLPYEVPLIFSNDGLYEFYKYVNKGDSSLIPEFFKSILGIKKENSSKIPFQYKISKDTHSVRVLNLVHPAIQFEFTKFYQQYDAYITYLCSKSEFSLRYPKKVASAVYRANNSDVYEVLEEELNPLKHEKIELDGEDKKNQFSSNYFSYKQFNMLYKFFESTELIRLEKKFPYMVSLDVSRCFDTIYTHSISWAVKGKDYSKQHHKDSNDFSEDFDILIRKANDNETNGIVIGPEFSRVFSEIIFQKIDQIINDNLRDKYNYIHNKDYSIRRYVDDFFLFSVNKLVEDNVKKEVINSLWEYKFRINPAKIHHYIRPFTTERSRNISELRIKLEQQFSKLMEKKKNNDEQDFWELKNIIYPLKASSNFIKDIKSCWHNQEILEANFSNYILSSLLSKYFSIIKLSKNIPREINGNTLTNLSIFFLDVAHYCFALQPKVSESYKFCQLLIIMAKFIKIKSNDFTDKINHKIYEVLMTLLKNELSGNSVCSIEKLNVLLTLSDVDRDYLPEVNILKSYIFSSDDDSNYFNIIVALYLAKDDVLFSELKIKAFDEAKNILANRRSLYSCSESIYLFLDLLSCPYLLENEKVELTKGAIKKLSSDYSCKNPIGEKNINSKSMEIIRFNEKRTWFVDWGNIDLLMNLQRKLLKESY